MSYIEPPWYLWLAAVPLYGTPLYVIVWAIHRFNVRREPRRAVKGLAVALGSWIGVTILYFVADFVVAPCLENCSQFRTPEGNARAFALVLLYTVLAATIVWRLHGYGARPGGSPPAAQA